MPLSDGKGSFRGVGFITVQHELVGGRRQPTYAIPFEDGGAISVDVGRAIRKYRIKCFVAGDDYREKANALLDALETPGAGTLIHPVFGRRLVTVGDDVSQSEDTTRLRVVDFSFTVTEALDDAPSTPPVNAIAAVQTAARKVKAEAKTVLSDPRRGGLPTKAIADWVRKAHVDLLQDVLGETRKINGLVSAVTAVPSGYGAEITALSQELVSVIQTPGRLASSLLGLYESIAGAVNTIKTADPIAQVRSVDGTDAPINRTAGTRGSLTDVAVRVSSLAAAPDVPGNTPERTEQRSGQVAIQTTVRAMALASVAEAALGARYDSASDARAVRDTLSAAIRSLANGEPEPDSALADLLRDLAAKVTAYLTTVAGTLKDLGIYETSTSVAAEVLAHRLYGDAELADQITLMNRGVITNPGCIPAYTRLEVWR